MPRSSNQSSDVGYTKPFGGDADKDNVYLSDQGWVYRHFKNEAKTEYWDEILVAGAVPSADSPAAFTYPVSGSVPPASPTFLLGDDVQEPYGGVATGVPVTLTVAAGGSGYSTTAGVALTTGSGDGLIVDITVTGDAITAVALDTAGTGYFEGEDILVPGGDDNGYINISLS